MGTDLQGVLHRPERSLGHLQLLVGTDRGLRGELPGWAGGADHVEPVQRGLLRDLLLLALEGERAVFDVKLEVL